MDHTYVSLLRNDAFCASISALIGMLVGGTASYFLMRPKRDSLGRFVKKD